MDKLLPCPFCGCEEMKFKIMKYNHLTEWHVVSCTKCKCKLHDISRERAFDAWNRRNIT